MNLHDPRMSHPVDDALTAPLPAVGAGTATASDVVPIELDGVRKAFGSFQVLDGVSAKFRHNEITTVLGPSGTGKSVLLKHIVGLLEPDEGAVRIFGEDLWALSETERFAMRKRFGLLFQDGALFGSMNLYDNVAFPLRKHTGMSEKEIREIVMHYFAEVGLENAIDRAPNEISGGMRKRAGVARALVMKPEIIMCDEPDSGLDPVRTKLLCNLIKKLHAEHGGTYVVITHNIEAARTLSDNVGVLWHGNLVHFGPADEAFNSPEPFVRQFLAGSDVGPLGME